MALDEARYPAYATVRRAAAEGGNRGAILNAADEVAVAAFLAGGLPFTRIGDTIAGAVDRWGTDDEPSLDGILALDPEVRGALTAASRNGRRLMEVPAPSSPSRACWSCWCWCTSSATSSPPSGRGSRSRSSASAPPRITSVVWRGTRYSLNWIPLGGFVKMLGEDGDSEAEKMRERGLSEAAVGQGHGGRLQPQADRRADGRAAGRRGHELPAGRHLLLGRAGDAHPQWDAARLTVTEIQADSPAEEDLQVGGPRSSRPTAAPPGIGRPDCIRPFPRRPRGHARDRARRSLIDVTVIPRRLTDQDLAQGKGAIGFSYEPERFVEVPSSVSGPIDAMVKGFSEAATWLFASRAVWPRRSVVCSV